MLNVMTHIYRFVSARWEIGFVGYEIVAILYILVSISIWFTNVQGQDLAVIVIILPICVERNSCLTKLDHTLDPLHLTQVSM